jgi:hypothetical protein
MFVFYRQTLTIVDLSNHNIETSMTANLADVLQTNSVKNP